MTPPITSANTCKRQCHMGLNVLTNESAHLLLLSVKHQLSIHQCQIMVVLTPHCHPHNPHQTPPHPSYSCAIQNSSSSLGPYSWVVVVSKRFYAPAFPSCGSTMIVSNYVNLFLPCHEASPQPAPHNFILGHTCCPECLVVLIKCYHNSIYCPP
jgi:hypothetical protein